MDIVISNTSDRPIYEQIVTQIQNLIMSGSLSEGDALPSMRLLAKELRISVITTKRAYEELERGGFITTMAGKGCFVAGKNLAFVREHQLRTAQEHIQSAVDIAKQNGISLQELIELLEMLYEGEI